MRSTVVLQWSRLGDVLQTRPLLRSLRLAPYERVILSADAGFSGVVRRMPEQPEFWPLDIAKISAAARHSTSHADFIRLLDNVFRNLNRVESPDVYVLTRSTAAALFAKLLEPRAVYGYALHGADLIEPEQVRRMDSAMQEHRGIPVHLGDLWASLNPNPFYGEWLPPLIGERCASVLREEDCRTIGFLCDAGESYRAVPGGWLAQLAANLLNHLFIRIELYGKGRPAAADALTELASARSDRVTDQRGQTSLDQLCDALANADLVVGPDTGGLHLAAAVGTPVIGLFFGGAVCLHTGPYCEQSVVLQDLDWTDVNASRVAALAASLLRNEMLSSRTHELPVFVPRLDEYGIVYYASGAGAYAREFIEARKMFFECSHSADDFPSHNGCELSVIIPEKGESHYTEAILSDLEKCAGGLTFEIIVVSSGRLGEHDNTAAGLPRIRYVFRSESLTFAESCNLGAGEAQGKWLLFLNNDCRVDSSFLPALLQKAGNDLLLSPLIRYPDGLIQNAGVWFDSVGIHEAGHGTNTNAQSPDPHALSAVALLMSKEAFGRLNGFDTAYRNGYEDLDLSLRAREMGYGLSIASGVEVTHFRGSTEGRFEHDDANRRLFVERWHRVFDQKSVGIKSDHNKGKDCPIVLVSHEPETAAGSCLRWIWPLMNRGCRRNADFVWLRTPVDGVFDESDKRTLSAARYVVVFRPLQSAENRQFIEKTIAQTGAMLVVDADDLFLGRFRAGSIRAVQRAEFEDGYLRLLDLANGITVSTSFLRECLSEYGFKAAVLPTVPCRQMLQPAAQRRSSSERRLGFFGTPAHHVDLGGIVPAIEQILLQHDDVHVYWWGCRPGELVHHPRVRQGGPVVEDYSLHLQRLARFGLDVALTPLLVSPASQARSPIKYFEYALAGIPSVYSRVLPYTDVVTHGETGLLADEATQEWVGMIDVLLSEDNLRNRIRLQAQKDVLNRMNDRITLQEQDACFMRLFPEVFRRSPGQKVSAPCPI